MNPPQLMWLPPALWEACADPTMKGIPLEILTRCWYWLEPLRYRPLPLRVVIEACGVKDITASRTLEFIVEGGYMERGPDFERGVKTYRVLTTRAVRRAA